MLLNAFNNVDVTNNSPPLNNSTKSAHKLNLEVTADIKDIDNK